MVSDIQQQIVCFYREGMEVGFGLSGCHCLFFFIELLHSLRPILTPQHLLVFILTGNTTAMSEIQTNTQLFARIENTVIIKRTQHKYPGFRVNWKFSAPLATPSAQAYRQSRLVQCLEIKQFVAQGNKSISAVDILSCFFSHSNLLIMHRA